MKKSILFIVLLFVALTELKAATITAAVSGNWGTDATWDCNCQPADGDDIIIPNGITVTIDFFLNVDLRGGGVTTVTIQSGGILTGVGFSGLQIDSGDGDLITVDAGGTISPEVYVNFDGGFFPEVVISAIPCCGFVPTVPGPATVENGALPVEILFFNLEFQNNRVYLFWATASEENFDYFSIERSLDGKNFKEIAKISGVGNSYERVDYEYRDEFPLNGYSYYRLRSIDFDGYTEIFDYVVVEIEGLSNDFSVFPNPIVNGSFSLQTNFEIEEEAGLIIYNSMGAIEKEIPVKDWLSNYSLNELQPGNYLFKLVSTDGVVVKRILIE